MTKHVRTAAAVFFAAAALVSPVWAGDGDNDHHQHHDAHGPVVEAKDFDHAVSLIRDGLESLGEAVGAGDMHALHTLSDGVAFPARALGRLAAARAGAAPANLRAINTLGQDLAKLVDAMHHAADAGKSDVVVAKWEEIKPLRAQLDVIAPRPRLVVSPLGAAQAVAGQPLPVELSITNPQGTAVTSFDPIHGASFHAMTVCPDLVHFAHETPVPKADGTAMLTARFAHAGMHTLFVIARPQGAASALALRESIPVAGVAADSGEKLAADTETSKLVSGYLVRARFPAHIHAGEAAEIVYRVDEQAAPGGITFERRYDGSAFLTGISADRRRLVTASAIESAATGQLKATITFTTPGLHATFLEFWHKGQQHIARFVIDVHGAECDHDH
ncbi:MAG: hypothetical protein ACKVZJ_02760 [Phycisphaerales bacterium]